MGELINLAEYKEKKEHNEIKQLQQELSELIHEMGGIHVAPMMMTTEDTVIPSFSFHYNPAGDGYTMDVVNDYWEISGHTYTYEDGKKE